jgi:hypothetical protein
VSEAEYEQIMRTGQFELAPGSLEGKWFCDTLEGATKFGNSSMGPGPGKFRLIEADVPDNAPGLFKKLDQDHLGPSRYLPIEDLNGVKPRSVGGP